MFVLLNNEVPTLEQLRAVMRNALPDVCEVISHSEYEENIQFEPLYMVYGTDSLMFAGYCGYWELLAFDDMTAEAKIQLSNNMFEWAEDEFKFESIDSIEWMENWHGADTIARWKSDLEEDFLFTNKPDERAYTIEIVSTRKVEVIGDSWEDAKSSVKAMFLSGDAVAELGDATFIALSVRDYDADGNLPDLEDM